MPARRETLLRCLLFSQVCGFLLGSNSTSGFAPNLPGQKEKNAAKVPGTLLSGLGGSSLLEQGAIVLEEGRIFV